MIVKRLQRKFVAIMMGVLLAVFAVVVATLNIMMQISSSRQTGMLLQAVVDRDGIDFHMPDDMPDVSAQDGTDIPIPAPMMLRSGRFFYVKVGPENEIIDAHYDMIFDLILETVEGYAREVLSSGKTSGKNETFQYLVAEKDYGRIIAFAERGMEMQLLQRLIGNSLWIAGAACLVLFGFSVWLSRWAVRPVQDAFDKQRRFVSDASHELKTPLTIISANADVLEHEIGNNIRLTHIQEQSTRMNALIHDMLSLARTEERNEKAVPVRFDLSSAVLSTVLEFESRVFEEGKTLRYQIDENIFYLGNETQLKQMVAIFVDNAIKHSDESGTMEVKLALNEGKIVFTVCNTGEGIVEAEQERIFERFYRSDASRSRKTGGYGLGLAIAKSIVEHHSGKITVASKEGEWVRFRVAL